MRLVRFSIMTNRRSDATGASALRYGRATRLRGSGFFGPA
jgi:hypothetical protein